MRTSAATQTLTLLVIVSSVARSLAAVCEGGNSSLPLSSIFVPSTCSGNAPTVRDKPSGARVIYLEGLFPFSGDAGLKSEVTDAHLLLPAAALALDDINCDSNLLPGYHLRLDVIDTGCDAAQGLEGLVDGVNYPGGSPEPRLAILGPGCGDVSEGLSGVAGDFLSLPLVSYSPSLARQDEFTSLFKMVSTISQAAEAALAVLDHFKWTSNIGLVYEGSSLYSSIIEEFVSLRPGSSNYRFSSEKLNYNADITVFREFATHNFVTLTDINIFLQEVRARNVRVIMTLLDENLIYQLFCRALEGTIPGDGFVWVMIGSLRDNWWESNSRVPNCTLTAQDVEAVISIPGEVVNAAENDVVELPNLTFGELSREYMQRVRDWCPDATAHRYFPITYDAMWSLALAINNSLDALESLNNSRDSQFTNTSVNWNIIQSLQSTEFRGASGNVVFNDNREREGAIAVLQFRGGRPTIVGKFNSTVVFDQRLVVWPSNSTVVPLDRPLLELKTVPLWLLVISILITVAGIIFSVCMLIFNFKYGTHRVLRAGSQKLNYVIILGMWFGYVSVLLLTLLESSIGKDLTTEVFKFFCILRLWLLTMSFTLSYGIMFARAWRVYRIFNDPFVSRRRFLKDYQLVFIDGILIIGDLVILVPWVVVDPYRRILATDDVNYEAYNQCTFFACASVNLVLWLGAVFLYKILIMCGGIFVVSLVRKGVVQRKIFDDSKSLSLALYISALCFIIGLPVQFLFQLQYKVVFAYVVNVIWVNISANATIGCVFLPKFYAIIIKKDSGRLLHTARSFFVAQDPSANVTDKIDGEHASVYHIYTREDLFSEASL